MEEREICVCVCWGGKGKGGCHEYRTVSCKTTQKQKEKGMKEKKREGKESVFP